MDKSKLPPREYVMVLGTLQSLLELPFHSLDSGAMNYNVPFAHSARKVQASFG